MNSFILRTPCSFVLFTRRIAGPYVNQNIMLVNRSETIKFNLPELEYSN